jgi:hypothetical protein
MGKNVTGEPCLVADKDTVGDSSNGGYVMGYGRGNVG